MGHMSDLDTDVQQHLRDLAAAGQPDVSSLADRHVAAMVQLGRGITLDAPRRQTTPPRRSRMLAQIASAKVVALIAAATLTVGTAAAAGAGALPAPAQDALAGAAAKVGFTLPASTPTPPDSTKPATSVDEAPGGAKGRGVDGDAHGAAVKEVAQGDLTGREKGKAVSAVASAHGRATAAENSAPGKPKGAPAPAKRPDSAGPQGTRPAAPPARPEGAGRPPKGPAAAPPATTPAPSPPAPATPAGGRPAGVGN
jgi:hypothetical protein